MRLAVIALAFVAIFIFAAASGQPPAGQDVERTLRFSHTQAPQDIQEIAVAVRVLSQLPRTNADVAARTLSVRGPAASVALAEWVFKALDQPPGGSAPGEYRLPGGGDDLVRVFFLKHAIATENLQEIATVVRSTADIRYAFTYNRLSAVTLRTTEAQMSLAAWLLDQLDRPPQSERGSSEARPFRAPGGGDEVVRVFYVPDVKTTPEFRKFAEQIWTATHIRRAFTYSHTRALTLRATAAQVAEAEQLINQR
ncbi:MAG: hypothetical protein KIT09_04225 [Bryobacteraceae bacterium]|nr:hypothetical protein [Bryobacteraceae bacterium]